MVIGIRLASLVTNDVSRAVPICHVHANDVVLALLNPLLARRSNGSVGRIGPSSVECFSGVTNVLHALER